MALNFFSVIIPTLLFIDLVCTCDRLSEGNMAVISNEIENIYIHNSRNGMLTSISLLNDYLQFYVLTSKKIILNYKHIL